EEPLGPDWLARVDHVAGTVLPEVPPSLTGDLAPPSRRPSKPGDAEHPIPARRRAGGFGGRGSDHRERLGPAPAPGWNAGRSPLGAVRSTYFAGAAAPALSGAADFFGRSICRMGFEFGNIDSSNCDPLSILVDSMKNAVFGSD